MSLKFYWAVGYLYVVVLLCWLSVGCSPTLPSPYLVMVCGGSARSFQLLYWERVFLFAICFLGVFGDVIPKYLGNKNATRHMEKRNSAGGNPILFLHVVAGSCTVLGTGIAGIVGLERGSLAFFFLVIADLIHQVSIVRLVKNHDGVWALRVGNFIGCIHKFITILNFSDSPITMVDILFIQNTGFISTRIAGTFSAVHAHLVKNGDTWIFEKFYSIGTLVCHILIMLRFPQYTQFWLLICPFVGYFYYHELWPKDFKLYFLFGNVVFGALNFFVFPNWFQTACILAYYFWTFRFPIFYRFPKKALAQYYSENPTGRKATKKSADPSKSASQLAENGEHDPSGHDTHASKGVSSSDATVEGEKPAVPVTPTPAPTAAPLSPEPLRPTTATDDVAHDLHHSSAPHSDVESKESESTSKETENTEKESGPSPQPDKSDEEASEDEPDEYPFSPLSNMSFRRISMMDSPVLTLRAVRGKGDMNGSQFAKEGWKFSGETPWVSPSHAGDFY